MKAFVHCDYCVSFHLPDEVCAAMERLRAISRVTISRGPRPPIDTGRLSASITKPLRPRPATIEEASRYPRFISDVPKPEPTPVYSFCKKCREMHHQPPHGACDPAKLSVYQTVGADRVTTRPITAAVRRVVGLFVEPAEWPKRVP